MTSTPSYSPNLTGWGSGSVGAVVHPQQSAALASLLAAGGFGELSSAASSATSGRNSTVTYGGEAPSIKAALNTWAAQNTGDPGHAALVGLIGQFP